MIQAIIIGIVVVGAVAYLARMAYRSFTSSGCETGCGKCSAIDVDAIAKAAGEANQR